MIDFHSHILPGIDDGSRSIEESAQMIAAEMEDGVSTIIATPHFYASETSASSYLKKRDRCEEELRDYLKQLPQAPEIRVGAEVYYFSGMANADILDDLCIQGTRTLLVEMPFAQWKESCHRDIRDLIKKRKFQVILAHVERYPQFQKSKDVWDDIMALPLTKQINAGSFHKKGLLDKRHRFVMKFMEEHEHVIIGSDCHNTSSRKPNLGAGRAAIEKRFGRERLARIDEIGEKLLKAY